MKKGPEMKEYTLIIKGEMDFIILSPQVLSSLIAHMDIASAVKRLSQKELILSKIAKRRHDLHSNRSIDRGILIYRRGFFSSFSCSFFLSIFRIVSTVCLAIKYSCISFLT